MESERVSPCSKQRATGTEPHETKPQPKTYIRNTHFNIILPFLLRSSQWSLQVPCNILCTFFIYPLLATCPAHHILDFITLIFDDEQHKLWSSSLCSVRYPPINLSLLGPDTLLSIVLSEPLWAKMWFGNTTTVSKYVKQSLYTPWRRLRGEEV
jgi:hypothetical protein